MHYNKYIYIIRHGQTDFNKKRVLQGSGIDAALNDVGEQQAKGFFDRYKTIPFEKILISTLQRTRQSVQSFVDLGIPTQEYIGLNEISFGNKEGVSFEDEDIKYYNEIIQKWKNGELNEAIEGGESPLQVAQRQKKVIKELTTIEEGRDTDQHLLICMHGRAMRMFLSQLLNHPLSKMDYFAHTNLTLYRLVYNSSTFRIDLFNNTEHLSISQD